MDLQKVVSKGECWMTAAERRVFKELTQSLQAMMLRHGVTDSPLLSLRIADLAIHFLLVRRIENVLMPDPEQYCGVTPELSGTLAEHIGKSRERFRKSIRELEDACARLGRPIDTGIADQVLPLMRKTRDLLDQEPQEDVEFPNE